MLFTNPVTILILDDNSSFVLSLLRSFSGCPNVKIDVLLSSPKEPNYFRYSRNLRRIYREQLTEENFERIVKEVVFKSSADLIIPTREWISKLIYKHKASLESIVKLHPVSEVNTIDTINDKVRLNCWLEKNNFPCSLAVNLNEETGITRMLDLLSFPILLKPVIGLGGSGIKMIENKENLESTLAENEVYKKSFFIQEYIDGYDIGVNLFSINGTILCHTIQKGLFSGQLTYSRGTEFIRKPELFELTSDIISKLKYTGVANLDFRFDSKKGTFVLIDFNARYWSTLDGSRFMGVNFPLLVSAFSLGVKCSYPDYSTGTYYCTKAAIKTLMRNLYSKKKYPINLLKTKLSVVFMDPAPEIARAGELCIEYLRNSVRRQNKMK